MEGVLMIKKSLTISDVVQILENANEYNYISAPPSKPKANQVFLYKTDDAAKEGNNILKEYSIHILLLQQKQHHSLYKNSCVIFFQ